LAAVGLLADETLVVTMEQPMNHVAALVVIFLVLISPWIAMASAGGFDVATWQTIGRSKPAWFVAMLLLPPVAIAYWLLVRPQLRAAARGS
jgi:hypothetical protein